MFTSVPVVTPVFVVPPAFPLLGVAGFVFSFPFTPLESGSVVGFSGSVFPGCSLLFASGLFGSVWTIVFPSAASVSPLSDKNIPTDKPAINNNTIIAIIAIILFLLKVFDLPAIFYYPLCFITIFLSLLISIFVYFHLYM